MTAYGTTFDSTEDYYVLAVYENNNPPDRAVSQANQRWPIVVEKIDGDTFYLYHSMLQDTNAEDPIIMWQVTGH